MLTLDLVLNSFYYYYNLPFLPSFTHHTQFQTKIDHMKALRDWNSLNYLPQPCPNVCYVVHHFWSITPGVSRFDHSFRYTPTLWFESWKNLRTSSIDHRISNLPNLSSWGCVCTWVLNEVIHHWSNFTGLRIGIRLKEVVKLQT